MLVRMKKTIKKALKILTVLLLIIPTFSFAQLENIGLGGLSGFPETDTVIIDVSHQYPEPNQIVKVSAKSFSTDLKKQQIMWLLNGVKFQEGLGLTHTEVKMGPSGSKSEIKIVVTKQDLGRIQSTVTLIPYDLSIYAEAETYVPPFYRGKALASNQTNYKFTAITDFKDVNGNKMQPRDLVYRWKINNKNDPENSGPGKNTYYYKNNLVSRPVNIILEVTPINSNNTAKINRTFDFVEPAIVFYEDSPVFGTILDRAMLGNLNMLSKELNIISVPYSFDKKSIKDLKHEWSINNKLDKSLNKNTITLRREDGKAGRVTIKNKVFNDKMLLQYSTSNLVLTFNKQ